MSSLKWMRFSSVLASGCQWQSRNSPGSIPESSDSVESEGDEAVLNNVHKKEE
jgi:hypothetical protein